MKIIDNLLVDIFQNIFSYECRSYDIFQKYEKINRYY